MIDAHSMAQARQAALAQSKGITPAENDVSAKLMRESDEIVSQLSSASAADIDLTYMETQVTVHQKALDTLDNVLIPSAEDADLKAELKTTRGDVQDHLDNATALRDKLKKG